MCLAMVSSGYGHGTLMEKLSRAPYDYAKDVGVVLSKKIPN